MDKEKDTFSEIVKDKLVNYTLPVDDDSWDKIAERLNPHPHGKTQRWWIAAISAAASIALLFLFFTLNKKTYHHETANQLSGNEKTIVPDVSEKETVLSVLQQNVESLAVFKKFQPSERLAENNRTTEVIPEEKIPEENIAIVPEEKPSVPEKYPISFDSYFNLGEEMQIPSIKHQKRQSYRFSISSGGNLLAQNSTITSQTSIHSSPKEPQSSELSYFRAVTQEENEIRMEDILSNKNYSDIVHNLPISLGVTVKKELNRTFAIESGIVYSYVTTKFSRESYPKSKAELQLHYMGIPLNIHTHIYKDRSSQWSVYLSIGGMVEKGFLLRFVQKTYYDDVNNDVKTVASNERIKGLQWSAGISPGIDYKIHKNYSIYLEPKLSYYFDNDQPVSARTKHPIVVGINAGVRYGW